MYTQLTVFLSSEYIVIPIIEKQITYHFSLHMLQFFCLIFPYIHTILNIRVSLPYSMFKHTFTIMLSSGKSLSVAVRKQLCHFQEKIVLTLRFMILDFMINLIGIELSNCNTHVFWKLKHYFIKVYSERYYNSLSKNVPDW